MVGPAAGLVPVENAKALRVNHFRYPHARARGARCRFQIAVSFFSFSGATPALPRLAALAADGAGGGAQSRPSYAVAAEGRPRLRSAVGGSASTISVTLTRAREAPGADSRSRFHFLVSAARRRRCRGWRRWPPMVPAAELNRGRATRWLPKAARASAPP